MMPEQKARKLLAKRREEWFNKYPELMPEKGGVVSWC